MGVDSTPKIRRTKKIECEVENIDYEKTVSECKKLRGLIQEVGKIKTTIISLK